MSIFIEKFHNRSFITVTTHCMIPETEAIESRKQINSRRLNNVRYTVSRFPVRIKSMAVRTQGRMINKGPSQARILKSGNLIEEKVCWLGINAQRLDVSKFLQGFNTRIKFSDKSLLKLGSNPNHFAYCLPAIA